MRQGGKLNMNKSFDIPVVLLLFKRKDAALRIIERFREVKISTLYLMGDQGRDADEKKLVQETREAVEKAIDWDCNIVKNYATENRGVYGNIALGAKWVFEREKWAIFLEDDNLPEITFFSFCEELLRRYENDSRILWICGTNYLGKYEPDNEVSYMFTKHMLPCGWASWSNKFLKYYDGYVTLLDDQYTEQRFINDFPTKDMSEVYMRPLRNYKKMIAEGKQPSSWDYQMCLSVRANSMFGISPVYNQIKNIGVDEMSEHGGNTMAKVMTRRFCGMESYPLDMPLKHPISVITDLKYEHLIDLVVTPPVSKRIRHKVAKCIKKMLGKNPTDSLFGKR